MIDAHAILLFIPFMILAAASPGPDVLYVISRSIGQKPIHAIVAAMGISTGLCVLSGAVALGLGQLFVFVPIAYDIMKYVGAAYLMYLAYKIIRSQDGGQNVAREDHSLADIYWQGVFTNLLNPKAIMFFMAVLPQFTDAARGDMVWQLATIAALATIIAFVTHSTIGLCSNAAARMIRNPSPRRAAIQRYVLGGMFAYVAVRLAQSQRP